MLRTALLASVAVAAAESARARPARLQLPTCLSPRRGRMQPRPSSPLPYHITTSMRHTSLAPHRAPTAGFACHTPSPTRRPAARARADCGGSLSVDPRYCTGVDGTGIVAIEWDHRIAREEWEASVPQVREAGSTWAPYIRLRDASASDFDQIDQNGGGYVDFRQVQSARARLAAQTRIACARVLCARITA